MGVRLVSCCVLIALGAGASAGPRLVTNARMCDFAPDASLGEMGMTLSSTHMEAIEYFCEFAPGIAFSWETGQTLARVGYCSEPGQIHPTVFVFDFGPWAPGVVNVWEQGSDQPAVFSACPQG